MPYWQLFYHIVWTTKKRLPLLTPDVEPVVYEFLRVKAVLRIPRFLCWNVQMTRSLCSSKNLLSCMPLKMTPGDGNWNPLPCSPAMKSPGYHNAPHKWG